MNHLRAQAVPCAYIHKENWTGKQKEDRKFQKLFFREGASRNMRPNAPIRKTNFRCEKKITHPRFVLAMEKRLTYHTAFVRFSPEPPQVFGHGEKAAFTVWGEDEKPLRQGGENGVIRMDGKQNGTSKWVEIAVKVALSLAATFPLYFLFYLTYPASIFALYIITAGLFLAFAPWDDLKKRFLS